MSLESNLKTAFKALCVEIKNNRFLPSPSHNSSTETHFYFGWSDTGLVQRQKRSDASTQSFTSRDFAADWSNRENLGYV